MATGPLSEDPGSGRSVDLQKPAQTDAAEGSGGSLAASALAFGLTGFVLGIIVTLLAIGAFKVRQNQTPVATLPPSTPVADVAMRAQITKIVQTQLGPAYPGPARTRIIGSIILSPLFPQSDIDPTIDPRLRRFRSVTVKFALNDHPLGKPWRLRAARADVFNLMKALYTSQLPIYNVYLQGYFHLHGKPAQRQLVLRAYMDYPTAGRIPWKRWDRAADEARLWSLLPYKYVNPAFG